ncbi:MAG: hypothetical protein AAFQ94_02820 [Bacteroidota bacterium]
MKLPNQTKAIEKKTYNANAVTSGVNASSFLSALAPIATRGLTGAINGILG